MAEDNQHDRTEAPTQRRRDEARKQGQVAFSPEIGPAAALTAGGGLLWWSSQTLAHQLIHLVRVELRQAYHPQFDVAHAVLLVRWCAMQCVAIVMPFMVLLTSIAVLLTTLQVGFLVSWEPLQPDWSKLSWSKGWSKLMSFRSASRGGMLLLKVAMGVGVVTWYLSSRQLWLYELTQASLFRSVTGTWTATLTLMLMLGVGLLTLGGLDYLYQRWQLERSLMMTRQEIRDEHKQMEGDPQVKARIRRAQREMLKFQMLRKVKDATVVLTNPTHLAVALMYDRATMKAPRVIAKGKGVLAQRIARIARQNGVPVLERKPLARAIYASVALEQEIPPNLYKAIAEILAHVYRLRRAG